MAMLHNRLLEHTEEVHYDKKCLTQCC